MPPADRRPLPNCWPKKLSDLLKRPPCHLQIACLSQNVGQRKYQNSSSNLHATCRSPASAKMLAKHFFPQLLNQLSPQRTMAGVFFIYTLNSDHPWLTVRPSPCLAL